MGRAWTYAVRLAAAMRDQLVDATSTGRQWRRTPTTHPTWCAADHTCTAGRVTGGTHRSDPMVWDTRYGRLIATRTSAAGSTVEIRLVVAISHVDEVAGRQVQALVGTADMAVAAVLAGPWQSAIGGDRRELASGRRELIA